MENVFLNKNSTNRTGLRRKSTESSRWNRTFAPSKNWL